VNHDKSFGNLRTAPPSVLADRLARAIMEYASPRAVTLDPDGHVWLERVDAAAEADLVGVYTRSLGLLELSRAITADLQASRREFVDIPRRVVVGREGTAKRRAA
jgi:hypothetical protein